MYIDPKDVPAWTLARDLKGIKRVTYSLSYKKFRAYGYYYGSFSRAALHLKPKRADIERNLGRSIRVDRKGLNAKLKDPNDFDVVAA